MECHIGVISGDGIGPEIVAEAKKVLDKAGEKYGHSFTYQDILMGGCSIDATGVPLTDEAIAAAKASDAVLMGSIGGNTQTSPWYKLAPELRPEAGLLKLWGLSVGTGEYSLDFGDGTTQQGYIVLRPVSMTYRTSTYEQSRAIIDRLSASDNINRISDLSIRRDERSGGGQGYQTVLTVTYFEVAP